ncbi:MAG: aminotransferase, partial [Gammaproteobacteria bacterium]|nr:aminotransferase [Gammaproteobacteria bacterium]
QAKRDLFNHGIAQSRFQLSPAQGTYFQNLDYSNIRPDLNAVDMCHFLAEQHGIVGIPVSAFYQNPPDDLCLIRFCFAKKTETLLRAAEILSAV